MIYFDNSASAIPNPNALDAAVKAMSHFANPSSPHFAGLKAREIIEDSRSKVAAALCCRPDEVFFTSSGTEANNIAILALAEKNKREGNVILTTRAEHPSVLNTVLSLEKHGFKVIFVPVDGGEVDYSFIEDTLKTQKVCLVSLMQANNQNGGLTNLKTIREIINQTSSKALFHSDIVQGFLKVPDEMASHASKYCDTASLSAHKIGGLKGTGGLFVKKGLKLSPVIYGGGQEGGIRSGTENIIGIAAFGVAAKEFSPAFRQKISDLHRLFIKKATDILGDDIEMKVPENHIDALINLSLKGVKSEVVMNYLSSKGICISSSSACSTKAKENLALAAFGYGKEYNDTAIRIGFSPFNTEQEVETLVDELKNALAFRIKRK
jgi:cysteine desulfurase